MRDDDTVADMSAQPSSPGDIPPLEVEFCGEIYRVDPGSTFTIGRVGDLAIDDNPFLHRNFLVIEYHNNMWWVRNVGSRIAVTVAENAGMLQSWIGPGTQLPLVVSDMSLVFTAGPTTYEIDVTVPDNVYEISDRNRTSVGETTVGQIVLSPAQKLVILALAEQWLKRVGTGSVDIPRSEEAAERIGWTRSRFNRKLDYVCDKLDQLGVKGLRGGQGAHATYRRARLVEYAVAAQLVSIDDLPMLDEELKANQRARELARIQRAERAAEKKRNAALRK
ncbi:MULTISPECIES: hypothetical protein [unclassified Actinobaculum]|uniref:hypothetical protein n=1 Tax=unclassified Actinobaculum TaxID=2609299 RepID=UPI001F0B80DA|nr:MULTISPECIES: hypothetical protein [unclassified Actinobaculum]